MNEILLNLTDEKKFMKQYTELMKSGLHGIDVALLMGCDLEGSPLSVFLDKTKRTKAPKRLFQYKSRLAWDKTIADSVEMDLQGQFEEVSDQIINVSPKVYRDDFRICMINGVIPHFPGMIGAGIFYTAKVSSEAYALALDPTYHFSQFDHVMIWQMGLMELKWGLIAFTDGKNLPKYRIIRYDDKHFKDLLELAEAFWQNNVKGGVLPMPVGKAADDVALAELCPTKEKLPIHIEDEEVTKELDILQHIDNEIEALLEERKEIKQKVILKCGRHSNVIFKGYRVRVQTVMIDGEVKKQLIVKKM